MRAIWSLPGLTWVALFVGLILALALVLLPLMLAQSPDPPPVNVAETVAKVLAGLVAPFLVQWLKAVGRLSGPLAFALTLLVCYSLAAIALLLSGALATVEDLITQGAQVALLALTVYRLFFKPFLIGEDPDEVAAPGGG